MSHTLPKHRDVSLVSLSTNTKEPPLFGDDSCCAIHLSVCLGRALKIKHVKAMADQFKSNIYGRRQSDTALPHPYFKANLGLCLCWVTVPSLTVTWGHLKWIRIRFSQEKTWCNALRDLSDEVQWHCTLGWLPGEVTGHPHLENPTKHTALAVPASYKPLLSVLNRKHSSFQFLFFTNLQRHFLTC